MERFYIQYAPPIGTKVVSVRVGTEPGHKDFTVHEDLLRRSSMFFDAALNNDWTEASERMIRLPTHRPATFYIYVQWLYSGRLFSKSTSSSTRGPSAPYHHEWNALVAGYQLADYIQDVDFKDTLMDAMMQWTVDVPQPSRDAAVASATEIYDNTEKESRLRRFLVDISVWKIGAGNWEIEDVEILPGDYLRAVFAGLSRRLQQGRPAQDKIEAMKGTCYYHAHGQKPCYKTKPNQQVTASQPVNRTDSTQAWVRPARGRGRGFIGPR